MSPRGRLTNISILAGKSKTSRTLCLRGRTHSGPVLLPHCFELRVQPPHSASPLPKGHARPREHQRSASPTSRSRGIPVTALRDVHQRAEGYPVSTPRDIPQSASARRRVQRGLTEPPAERSAGCFEELLGSFSQISSARPNPQGAQGAHKARSAAGLTPRKGDLQRSSSVHDRGAGLATRVALAPALDDRVEDEDGREQQREQRRSV